MSGKKIETKEQIRIITEYLKGRMPRREAMRQAGVVSDTIVGWDSTYRNEGIAGFVTERNKVCRLSMYQSGKCQNIKVP